MLVEKLNLTNQGFSGFLAKTGQTSTHGVVVILGGESVMLPFLKLGKSMAKLLAKEGFVVVSVSLFGAVGLPDSPDQIPLEYALNAVSYLKKTEKYERVSILGMSMGSIAALGSALYSKDVDDLIMMSPSHVVFEGVSKDKKIMRGRSAFTYEGKDIPYVHADFSKYKMYEAYEKAYADKKQETVAMKALPISDTNARVLLLAGKRDSSWPSSYSVGVLSNELEKANKAHLYQKKIYPDYGHMLPLKKDVMKQVYSWLKETPIKQ